jgi:release factor glutamine methyltransferase
MHKNVLDHEPHVALFVPDEDALVFYDQIIAFAKQHEVSQIFFETHFQLAQAVAEIGINQGYKAELRKDLGGHERMVRLVNGH